MITVYRIAPGSACPICCRTVEEGEHRACIIQICSDVEMGTGRIENWADPMPGAFGQLPGRVAIRAAIQKQLAREQINVASFLASY